MKWFLNNFFVGVPHVSEFSNWARIGCRNQSCLGFYPISIWSVEWDKIWTHNLWIVSRICIQLDRTNSPWNDTLVIVVSLAKYCLVPLRPLIDRPHKFLSLKWRRLFLKLPLDRNHFCKDFLMSVVPCWAQMSISPTFYTWLFHTKYLRKSILCLYLRFELLLVQEYLCKCAHKILVKLSLGLVKRNQVSPFFLVGKTFPTTFWTNLKKKLWRQICFFTNSTRTDVFFLSFVKFFYSLLLLWSEIQVSLLSLLLLS